MGVKRKERSLKNIFFKYLASVGLGLLLAMAFVALLFTVLYRGGFIMPANETEKQIFAQQEKIAQAEEFSPALIPKPARYLYLSSGGSLLASDMDESLRGKAVNFHQGKVSSTPRAAFIEISRRDGYVIIYYSLVPRFTNAWLAKVLPNPDILLLLLLLIFSFLSTFLITILWAKRLTEQLAPVLAAAGKITQQELVFDIGHSDIKEFNEVLMGLDKMKTSLTQALRENWQQEERKKEELSALTHDLKNPIAIVRGNAELLEATKLSTEQREYVNYILKNINRLSTYARALMAMNLSNDIGAFAFESLPASQLAEKIRELVQAITTANQLNLAENIHVNQARILVDLTLFERAIQNILSNAVQYTPGKSTLSLDLMMAEETFDITIADQGPGFSLEALEHGTEQFYQSDKSRHSASHFGIGLYSAEQIILGHQGKLSLGNRENGSGAVVSIQLPLLKD